MHKALEILKNPMAIISANENHVYSKKQIDQVIVELEEAMKPKTCDGCKFLNGVICKHDRGLYCLRQFEADYFKPKEQWDDTRRIFF